MLMSGAAMSPAPRQPAYPLFPSLSLWSQAHLLHYLILIFLHLCFRSGRQRWLTTMAAAGVAPNVVAYTALLKGLCAEGDMNAAESLLRQMEKACHPDPS